MATSHKRLFRRFMPYYRPHLGILIFDLFCALLTTIVALVSPLIVREITNRSILDISSITIPWLMPRGLLYLALVLLEAGAFYYMQSRGHIMGAMIEANMRADLFAHLQQLSFSYYSNTKVGQIMSRITSDLFDITEFAHHGPENLMIVAIKLIASFVILITINVPLTLIIFALLPVILYVSIYYNLRLRTTFRQLRKQVGEINAQAEDTLLGMRVVQSFANEDIEQEKFSHGNMKFLGIKKKQYHHMAAFNSSTMFLKGLMNITVVIAGAVFLANGSITPGDYTSYLLYVNTMMVSMNQLINFSELYQRGMTGLERFFSVMDEPYEIRDLDGAQPIEHVKGEIRFENVSFSYPGSGDKKVLDNLNLLIPPGRSVALVGPSGSGKTTLCNLIPRFYDATEGRVLLDQKDVRSITLKSLRSAIGTVQQDVYLFSGTIAENITYGRPGASKEEMIAAAKQAGAHDFITELPEGYDTYVGERGVKLSGGQKQRISIARVFLKDPPILLLDEATSSLDNESEYLVQRSLEELAKGRTTLTIAHRLTTIRNADVIWVLTDQGLVEHGTHDELIQKQGVYAGLYRLYVQQQADGKEDVL